MSSKGVNGLVFETTTKFRILKRKKYFEELTRPETKVPVLFN
jgi:hypothetical protein